MVGVKSNRSAIGARIKVVAQTARRPRARPDAPLVQIEEVRSCNGYYSASDLRIHFGLGAARNADVMEIHWPSGATDTLKDLDVNRLFVIEEGGKILKTDTFSPVKRMR